MAVVEQLREKVVQAGIYKTEELTSLLKQELTGRLSEMDGTFDFDQLKPPVIFLVVGVNGTGKTTTIGKLAHWFKARGASVMVVAADTFRAAAVDQLQLWAGKVGVDLVKHQRGSDPAAVVYDAVQSMRANRHDFAIVDTAGRLHTYVNLMEELKKVKRVAVREAGADIPVKTLLVMDATTGQNGIAQAKLFDEALGLDGIVLTKLDGTAKGGVVLAIQRQLGTPIVLIGTGETIDDLAPFLPVEFIDALVG